MEKENLLLPESTLIPQEAVSKRSFKFFLKLKLTYSKVLNSVKKIFNKENLNPLISGPLISGKNYIFQKGNFKTYLSIGVGIVVIAILIFAVLRYSGSNTPSLGSNQPQVSGPLAQQKIDKTFEFPFNDAEGKELGRVKFTVQSAELRNQIYVKGQSATALKGKEFLIINLKLVNSYKQGVKINTRDYIRLSVNKKDEWLAPSIHNDPVEVQAISTDYTRVGFIINTTDKDRVLRVGEINGDKQTINLNLK